MRKIFLAGTLLIGSLVVVGPTARAQGTPAATAGSTFQLSSLDLAFTYTTKRSNVTPGGGSNFWAQGGSFDAGFTFFHGFGVAANLTGDHASNIAPGVNLSLMHFVAGPRYTLRFSSKHESRVFGEALFGGVHGFDSVFPVGTTVSSSANSFSMQVGGGWDIAVSKHLAIRAFEADFVRASLPNNGTNVQNFLRLAFGVTYHIPKH
jgi:peptidoglycan-associated lipoprotein